VIRACTRSRLRNPGLSIFAPGDLGASLILDFQRQVYGVQAAGGNSPTPKLFTDLVTFTRSSNAWYFNSAGAIMQASANAPRFDYDPVTLQPRGLLVEMGATRLNTISLAPTNPENVTVSAQAYTISFYGTGTVVLSGTASATINGTGAFPTRTFLTFTPTAGTLTLTPSGSVQNLQLEAGTFPTSIIQGEGSTKSRSADVASVTPLTPWFNTAAGTLYANYMLASIGVNSPQAQLVAISDGGNNRMALRAKVATTGNNPVFVVGNGTTNASLVSANANSGMMKAAGAYGASSCAECANAETPVLGATGYVDGGLTSIGIGCVSGVQQLSGWLASVKFYPTQYNSAALQALTT
jgi:hypothetical protein